MSAAVARTAAEFVLSCAGEWCTVLDLWTYQKAERGREAWTLGTIETLCSKLAAAGELERRPATRIDRGRTRKVNEYRAAEVVP